MNTSNSHVTGTPRAGLHQRRPRRRRSWFPARRYPWRLVTCLAACASLLNVLYMVYVMAVNLVKRQVAEGWTTLSLQVSVMFLFLFTTLVVIAEYLAHTLEETKDRPLYHVAEEKGGPTALRDESKRNVVNPANWNQPPDQPQRQRVTTARRAEIA